jgi:ethylmalonyl-CoA/methylmalonyl-CoA decarboxylase
LPRVHPPILISSHFHFVGWGGGVRLVKIVGRQIALRLLGTAERLDAQKAQALGLIDTTFHQEKISIEQACMDFLHPFDQVVAEVLHGAKKVVTCADDVSLDRILAYEHDVFSTLWGGPANLKALETSLNKKKKK